MSRKALDIKNQRFGRLVALEVRPKGPAGDRAWRCRCDCGAELWVPAPRLVSGNTRSCGCLKKETAGKQRILTINGQRFTKLVALEPTGERLRAQVVWRCRCDCGAEVMVPASSLTSGNTKSCGCLHSVFPGERYGYLLVIGKSFRDGSCTRVPCRCDCGTPHLATASGLRRGATTSCGCHSADHLLKHGYARKKARRPEYTTWASMMSRCTNPNEPSFANYGARGIGVCSRWLQFENFLADMGPHPGPELSLDRIDVNAGYNKDNCRWATRMEQHINRRVPVLVSVHGESRPLDEWLEAAGVGLDLARLLKGRRIEEVIAELLGAHEERE